MIISLEKTISIGDMGIIFLMYWYPNEKNEPDDKRRYFSVYYSNKYMDSAKGFTNDILDNGIVPESSIFHIILKEYVEEQLAENAERLHTDPEEAIFDVFKKLYADKMLVQDSKEGI